MWLVWLFSLLFSPMIFQEFDLDYIGPEHHEWAIQRQNLVPSGYIMIPNGNNVYSYVWDQKRICKVFADYGTFYYAIQNFTDHQTDFREWWSPPWKRFYICEKQNSQISTIPQICLPNSTDDFYIVLKQCNHVSYVISFTDNESKILEFTPVFDILAYDFVQNIVYAYRYPTIFKLPPEVFINTLSKNGLVEWYIKDYSMTNWSDILVVNGTIYYISEGKIYKYLNKSSQFLSQTNSDRFLYTLIPDTYVIDYEPKNMESSTHAMTTRARSRPVQNKTSLLEAVENPPVENPPVEMVPSFRLCIVFLLIFLCIYLYFIHSVKK